MCIEIKNKLQLHTHVCMVYVYCLLNNNKNKKFNKTIVSLKQKPTKNNL